MHPRVRAALEAAHVDFIERRHADLAVVIRNPRDFAEALAYETGRITKTLYLCTCERPRVYVIAVLSAEKSANLRAIEQQVGCRRLQVANRQELLSRVGYPPAGVSPIGVDETSVLIDASLFDYSTILVGAGEVGVEVEIAPADLRRLTNGIVRSIAR